MTKRARGTDLSLSWDDLRIVLALGRAGTLRASARVLGLDASNVGRRLTQIEERIGTNLFERTLDGLRPTVSARAIMHDAEAMEASAMSAERQLVASLKPSEGRVRVAVTDAFALAFIIRHLDALRSHASGVEVELVVGSDIASLTKRQADVALRFVRPTEEDLYARKVGSLRWSLYAAPQYLRERPTVSVEDGLEGHRMIRWSVSRFRPEVVAWMDAHTSNAETAAEFSQLHHIAEGCVAGLGLAVMPGVVALGRGGVRRVIDDVIDETELWIVVHRDARRVPRVRAVADGLAALLTQERESVRAM